MRQYPQPLNRGQPRSQESHGLTPPPLTISHLARGRGRVRWIVFGPNPLSLPRQDLDRVTRPLYPPPLWTEGQTRLKTLPSLAVRMWSVKRARSVNFIVLAVLSISDVLTSFLQVVVGRRPSGSDGTEDNHSGRSRVSLQDRQAGPLPSDPL